MRSLLAYSTNTVLEEKLTLRIRADNSGDIYIPTAGYSPDGTQDCEYDWMVGIDDNTAVEYSGVGSSTGKIRVGYGLTPLSTHTVIIKPKEEDYGWLRAFGYKGTSIANSLTNIINDKSYKGYALSEIYTGNYFKAYQYYGCTNLINTDEELLPNTLEIIGDNYRAYEYSGCVKLVSNADERILKTVKAIGDNYRAYQYQNCTGINRIYMRAINWASVGTGYRDNQYSGTATDKSPMNIYIEGGIEEGGSWGLLNDRVKNIYVYDGLVSDYQTKLNTITSSKIKKNAEWDNFEYEFIEFDAIADSNGEIRIPVGGYSTTGTQDCAYDWYVSIDGGEPEEISGTGGASYVTVGESLEEESVHRIIIKPKTIGWGWGRAFGYYNTGAEGYIKQIIHDSYKCYASNRIETGAYYKYAIYSGCTNLVNSYEKLPTSVTTIGDYYMKECNKGCTSLTTAFYEVMHKHCTLGTDYRYQQYYGCTSMSTHEGIVGYTGETYPTNYKYEYLTGAGDDANIYITRYEKLATGLTNSLGLVNNKVSKIYCFVDDIIIYLNNSDWSNLNPNRGKWQAYYYGYVCNNVDVTRLTKLLWTKTVTKPARAEWSLQGFDVSLNSQHMYTMSGYSYSYTRAPDILNGALKNTPIDLASYQIYDYDVYWQNRGVYAMDNEHIVVALNRDDYPNYAYGSVRIYNLTDNVPSSLSSAMSPSLSDTHNAVSWGVGASRNGQFVFCNLRIYEGSSYVTKINEIYTPTKYSFTGCTQTPHSGISGELRFSDDGMKMYYNGKIWNLSSPRYIDSRVDSGVTYPGGVVRGRYRYVFNGEAVYKYGYE